MLTPDLRSETRAILRLAGPVVLSRVGIMLMGLVDTIVVGRYSTDELSYMALGWAPVAVFLVTGIGVLQSVQVLAARRIGEGQPEAAGHTWHLGLWWSLIGGAIGAGMFLFGPQILQVLGQEPDVALGAGEVARILGYSIGFHLAWCACAFFLEAIGKPLVPVAFMLAANVINLIADVVLVHGLFGLPPMGAEGAAWATTLVRLFLSVGMAGYIWVSLASRPYGVRTFGHGSPARDWEQLRVGIALGAGLCFEVMAFAGMTVIAGWSSAEVVASYTIFINLMGLMFMVAMGVSAGTSVRVSEAYGAGTLALARIRGWIGLTVGLAAFVAMGVCLVLLSEPVARLFSTDAALLVVLAALFGIAALAIPFDGLQTIASSILRSRDDTWFATVSHFVAYVLVMLPLGYLFTAVWGHGAFGLCWAVALASFVSAVSLVLRWAWVTRRDGTMIGAPAG